VTIRTGAPYPFGAKHAGHTGVEYLNAPSGAEAVGEHWVSARRVLGGYCQTAARNSCQGSRRCIRGADVELAITGRRIERREE